MGRTEVRSGQVLDGTLTDADVAAANKDGVAGTPSMRTLGTGAQQAAPGNDSRFSSGLIYGTAGGRLTTETLVGVSTTDRVAQGVLRFMPFCGDQIGLFNGSTWDVRTFAETNITFSATNIVAGKIYDVFGYWNSTVFGLELSAAWTNDTTRADALALQNGILCKSGVLTRRFLGTIMASDTNLIEDSSAKRFVWNYYNRRRRLLMVKETSDSWNMVSSAWRYANANSANRVEVVIGYPEDSIQVGCKTVIGDLGIHNAIGVNSNTVATGWTGYSEGGTLAGFGSAGGHLEEVPRLGYSYYAWLERTLAGEDTNFYGDAGAPNDWGNSGMFGSVMG